jgi:hypothetical protein
LKVLENQLEMKLIGTHQLLVYADDVNLLGDNINTIKKNTETLISDASKKLGIEINEQKSELLPCHQNTRKTHYIKIANRSFENMAQFKYLGTTIWN